MNRSKQYIAVIGPTASGKSALAIRLAQSLGGELINCDSVQFYRGFNIGSAKPDAVEQALVPHHLWDILDWHEDFDARLFAERAQNSVDEVRSHGRIPILVGGTGLYLRALWQEKWHDLPKSETLRAELSQWSLEQLWEKLQSMDPERAKELHPNDRFRIQRALEVATLLGHPLKDLPVATGKRDEAFVVRVQCERTLLHERIALRTEQMLQGGLIEEVEGLLRDGVGETCKPMQSIGYKEVSEFLRGLRSKAELKEAIVIATRQYAKRQETWFRGVKEDAIWSDKISWDDLLFKVHKAFLPES